MAGLLDLAKRMETQVAVLEQRASDYAVLAATAILKDLIFVTPVDTSLALSNWQVGLGTKPTVVQQAYSLGYKGSTKAGSSSQAFAAGAALLKAKKRGEPIFISNLTPYIKDLDRGTSKQFAGGFSARAPLVARRALKQGGAKLA